MEHFNPEQLIGLRVGKSMDDYEYYDPENDWDFDSFDAELWEEIIKKCIARQGPQYSEYKSCMWE